VYFIDQLITSTWTAELGYKVMKGPFCVVVNECCSNRTICYG